MIFFLGIISMKTDHFNSAAKVLTVSKWNISFCRFLSYRPKSGNGADLSNVLRAANCTRNAIGCFFLTIISMKTDHYNSAAKVLTVSKWNISFYRFLSYRPKSGNGADLSNVLRAANCTRNAIGCFFCCSDIR
jgi:hypothetical protein